MFHLCSDLPFAKAKRVDTQSPMDDDEEYPYDGLQLVADDPEPCTVDTWESFGLPYLVATFVDIEQRAYLNNQNQPEWLWSRTHAYFKIQRESWRLLQQNQANIKHHLEVNCQVDSEEFRYRGQKSSGEGELWKDHAFLSRGWLCLLLWVSKNRPLKAENKHLSMKLLFSIVSKSFQYMCQLMGDTPITLIGMAISKSTGSLVSEVLTFTHQGHCTNWDRLVQHVPGAKTLWERLRREIWNGYCISTSLEQASFHQ